MNVLTESSCERMQTLETSVAEELPTQSYRAGVFIVCKWLHKIKKKESTKKRVDNGDSKVASCAIVDIREVIKIFSVLVSSLSKPLSIAAQGTMLNIFQAKSPLSPLPNTVQYVCIYLF